MQLPMALFGAPGPWEFAIVGLIAVLLFGKRLPEVARSVGKGFVEFRRGLKGVEDDMHDAVNEHHEIPRSTEKQSASAPKFEPPTSPPTQEEVSSENTASASTPS